MNKCFYSLSSKISWLSFLAICFVISIHCQIGVQGTFQNLYIHFGTVWAVPFFFLVSGFFLRLGFQNTTEGFSNHVVKKLRTLVLPYLLWCLIGLIIRFPIVDQCATGLNDGWLGALNAVFGVTNGFPLGLPVLWFVRSLIVLQIVTPALFGCFSEDRKFRCGCWMGTAVGIGLLFIPTFRHFALALCGTPSSPFYFLAGFIFAPLILKLPISGRSVVMVALGGIVALIGSMVFCHSHLGLGRHLLTLSIITTLWFVYDLLFGQKNITKVPVWCKCTFFIYCCHFVPLEYVRYGLLKFNGSLGLSPDWCFFGLIVFVPIFFTWFAHVFKRFLPNTYAVLSGGR